MRYYCTYFDINFLSRGLVLFESLSRHENDFVLFALCLDRESDAVLNRLKNPQFIPIPLCELEAADPRLPVARANRTKIEYYFTLSPFLPRHLLRTRPEIDLITYIDADCCFYSSPQPIYDELGEDSILMIEHRFAQADMDRLRWGRYNVGLLVFRNDSTGRQCLERWATQCADWCCDRLEDGKFADQKYLDDWPAAFSGVHILHHTGVNVAPWNIANSRLRRHGGRLCINNDPLIMYHFHGFHFLAPGKFWPSRDHHALGPEHIRFLYMPYAQALTGIAGKYHIPVGGYGRNQSADRSDQSISCAAIGKWPSSAWWASWRWRAIQAQINRQSALSGIIEAFQSSDWTTCAKYLREGLLRYPSLLFDMNIWNILYRSRFK